MRFKRFRGVVLLEEELFIVKATMGGKNDRMHNVLSLSNEVLYCCVSRVRRTTPARGAGSHRKVCATNNVVYSRAFRRELATTAQTSPSSSTALLESQ